MGGVGLTALVLAAGVAAGPGPPAVEARARVSLDVREGSVREIASALLELGGFQVVFDPDVRCSLTLKLHAADWLTALDTTLRACGLGREEEAGVVRVAGLARLRQEAEERRRLDDARGASPSGELALFRLSYARAAEMAPLLNRLVSPRGKVTLDPRTNTLIVSY